VLATFKLSECGIMDRFECASARPQDRDSGMMVDRVWQHLDV
jgi:hypothetical protein